MKKQIVVVRYGKIEHETDSMVMAIFEKRAENKDKGKHIVETTIYVTDEGITMEKKLITTKAMLTLQRENDKIAAVF